MKKYKLILICFLLLSHSLLAIQAIIPDSIIGKQEEIKNFKVDIELAISTYSGQNSEFFLPIIMKNRIVSTWRQMIMFYCQKMP